MPWRVEGMAVAGLRWGMPGAAGLARASGLGMCHRSVFRWYTTLRVLTPAVVTMAW